MDFTGSPTKKRLIASFNIFDDGLGNEQKVSVHILFCSTTEKRNAD